MNIVVAQDMAGGDRMNNIMDIYALQFNFKDNLKIKYYSFNPIKKLTARQLAVIFGKLYNCYGYLEDDFTDWYINLYGEPKFSILESKEFSRAFYDYIDASKMTPRQFALRNFIRSYKIDVVS